MEGVKQTVKMKRVKRMVLKEEFYREKTLWIIFLLSIILSLWCSIPRFHIYSFVSSDIASAINVTLQSLSFSVIAGTIVYFITVFLPKCQKIYEQRSSIANNLYLLDKSIKSVMSVNCETTELFDDTFDVQSFMCRIINEDVTDKSFDDSITVQECDSDVHLKPCYIFSLNLIIEDIDTAVNSVLLLSSYLPPSDTCLLPMVKSCPLFSEIQKRYQYDVVFEEKSTTIRFGLLKWYVYRYKFIRDGIEQLKESYSRYITLDNV